jgi:hypothetical protein
MEVGPEVEVAGDELATLIDADRRRKARFGANPIQCGDDVLGAVAEPRIDRWEEGLSIRTRSPRRRRACRYRCGRSEAGAMNDVWAIDFMSDRVLDGQRSGF